MSSPKTAAVKYIDIADILQSDISVHIDIEYVHLPILPGRKIYEGFGAESAESPEISSIGSHIVSDYF